jgi:hypothetical protein
MENLAQNVENLEHNPVEDHLSLESVHSWTSNILPDSALEGSESYTRGKVAEEALQSADAWVWRPVRKNSQGTDLDSYELNLVMN